MATDTTPSPRKADTTMRYSILCPICQTEAAEATDAGFAATTVDVKPCAGCVVSSGMVALTIRKSVAYQLADKLDRLQGGDTVLIHKNGLVAFGG